MDMMWHRRRGLMVTPHIESASGSIASFNSDYNKIPVKSLICNIEPIQVGSGDPSPENVRPISGRAGLSVVRCGKNLCPVYDRSAGTYWGTNYAELTDFLNTLEVGTYSLKNKYRIEELPTNSENVMHACIFIRAYVNGQYIYLNSYKPITDNSPSAGKTYRESTIFTITEETKGHITDNYLYCDSEVHTGSGRGRFYLYDIFIEKGSSDVDYEPYKGSTYSVNWETEAGTVYGGYVDAVNGKITVDRAKRVLDGSEPWAAYPSFEGYLLWIEAMKQGLRQSGHSNMLKLSTSTDSGQKNTFWLGVNTKYIYVLGVYESMGNTVNNFKTYLSTHNLEIEYPLETPTEIQLTPQEVRTLLGVNNIWCDSGDVTVDYWKWGK